MMQSRLRRAALVIALMCGSVAAACGTDQQRIISLSPSATELLYALDLGEHIVAVDDQSNYPDEAPRTSGLSGFQPDSSLILLQTPDIVVLNADVQDVQGGSIVQKLTEAGVEVVLDPSPQSLDGLWVGIETLGEKFDRKREAKDLVDQMRTDLETIRKGVSSEQPPGRRFFHEVDTTFYSATSNTFIGSIYRMFGLRNIADAHDPTNSGYPQLAESDIIDANPELIFLSDAQTAQDIAARPNWRNIQAVRDSRVFPLNNDIASRWGPRIVDLARSIATALVS